jgi:(p)ppGpp synthase/HD superfamily hydrolase
MTEDADVVQRAAAFARAKHGDTLDDDGKLFFEAHLAKVADLLRVVTPDDHNLIAAGYLHDTLEDTDTTYEELVEEFGRDVADLVLEVTQEGRNDSYGYYWSPKRRAQYLRTSRFWRTGPNDDRRR